MNLVEVEQDKHGFFFAGDSYVILYKYGDGHSQSIVYFWQGSKSSTDEKGASAIHAARIDNDELGGGAVQVRVVQGQEPRHFIKMFGGNMVVFSGGKASGFNNVHDRDEYDEDGVRLFMVKTASGESDARVVQVEEKASSLNSDDVFLLETPKSAMIWAGKDSVSEEYEQAERLAALLCPDREMVRVDETKEDEIFWEALGGKTEYNTINYMDRPILQPRLFHVVFHPSSGVRARAFEVFDFEQKDLISDDVMLLDSGDEVYVWVGKEADKAEIDSGLTMATQFLDSDPTPRDADNSVIITIKEGREPDAFIAIFPDWEQTV